MSNNNIWVDGLMSKIINKEDVIIFEEATSCFLSKNLRAAYIMGWLSIIESLKRKIYNFSDLGDKNSKEALEKIEKLENEKSSADKIIFQGASKAGIIDKNDLTTIEYLWAKRCLFAHPYNTKPEEEDVKYILTQSVKLVLEKDLLYNRDYLEQLTKDIVEKTHFRPNNKEEIISLIKLDLRKTSEKLHPFFFKTLLAKLGEIIDDQNKTPEVLKLRSYIIELIIESKIPLTDEKWSLESKARDFPYETFIGVVNHETWRYIPKKIKRMLISYSISEEKTERNYRLKAITNYLIKKQVLEDKYIKDYYKKLSKDEFSSAIDYYGTDSAKLSRILEELKSRQFIQQNIIIDYIRGDDGNNFLKKIKPSSQFKLGKAIRNYCSSMHWKTDHLISAIINKTEMFPDEVIAGIAYGCFINENDKYEFDKTLMENAISLLNLIKKTKQEKVYKKIKKVLLQNKPDEYQKFSYKETDLTEIQENVFKSIKIWNHSNKEYFEVLTNEIDIYFKKEINT